MTDYDALALVLSKLEHRQAGPGRWLARCPAHDDTRPSLGVSAGTEQPVVLTCYAGCSTADVLAAIGLTLADVSKPRGDRDERDPVIATYRYTDEDGAPLFEVLRTAGKGFRQRRPDGRGGWAWKLDGVRRVPYRLPELAAAVQAGRTVYVAEGEKDVHAIEAAGGVATCNPGGAGKWRQEYAQHFAGADVVVVADRDEPGRKHAEQVRDSLRSVAASVAVVEAAEGKDAADHLAAGHGLEDFARAGAGGTKEHEVTKEVPSAVLDVSTNEHERTKKGAQVPVASPAIFAGVLGEVTEAAMPTTEADPVGVYASLLAGVGVLVGQGPHVQIGNIRHPLLVWPLLLGRTGSGRKGEATSTAEIFLRRAAPDTYPAVTVSGLSSGEGLIERLRDPVGELPGVEDKRLLVIETEFTSVMARSKREGSTLAAALRQAWEGDGLMVMNRKQLRASSSHVAIIGHITPQEFRLRLAEADMTSGTYNRYLPVFVERAKLLPIPERVSEPTEAALSGALARSIAAAREVGRVSLGREATMLWTDELYAEMTAADDEDQAHAEFTRRAAPYCLRIAGLLAALDGRALVGKGDLVSAGALVRYSIASARYVLDRQARDPRLERIRRAVDAAGEEGLTRTQISALFSRNLTKDLLAELLAMLTADGQYEESRTSTRGRPAESYRRVVSS